MRAVTPQARTSRLVTREVGNELLVYDLARHKAYCLNRIAMQVFRHCDGKTTIPDMALRIGNALGRPVDEQVVRLGLVRLEKAYLLDGSVDATRGTSRREMLRTLGRAAAVVMPLVTALSVPTSAQAVSFPCGLTNCQGCKVGDPCGPNRFCRLVGSGGLECE